MRKAVLVLAGLCVLLFSAGPAEASFRWSGYEWNARKWDGEPGPSHWNPRNVSVTPRGLRMRIVRRGKHVTSSEVSTKRTLGYGTYEWVLDTNPNLWNREVLGLFTYSRKMWPSYGEKDFEFTTQWDRHTGWWVDWNSRYDSRHENFAVSNRPPYTMSIKWTPSGSYYTFKDGAGVTAVSEFSPITWEPFEIRATMNFWFFKERSIERINVRLSPWDAGYKFKDVYIRSFRFTPGT